MGIDNDIVYFSHNEIETPEPPSQQEGGNEPLDEERVLAAEEMLTSMHFNAFWNYDAINNLLMRLAFDHIQITKFIVEAVHRRTFKPHILEHFDARVPTYNGMLYHSNVGGDSDRSLRARLMRMQTGLDNHAKKLAQREERISKTEEKLEEQKADLGLQLKKLNEKIEKEHVWLNKNKQFRAAFSVVCRDKNKLLGRIRPFVLSGSPDLMKNFSFRTKKGLKSFFQFMDAAHAKVTDNILQYVKNTYSPEEFNVFEAKALTHNLKYSKETISDTVDVDALDEVDEDSIEYGSEYTIVNPFEVEDNKKQLEEEQQRLKEIEEKEQNLLERQKKHEQAVADFKHTKASIMMLRKPLKAMVESGSPTVMDVFDFDDEMSIDWFMDICKDLKCSISQEILNYVDEHYSASVAELFKEKAKQASY